MNPLQQLYSALWSQVTRSARLSELVVEGNRVRYDETSSRDPLKQSPQVPGDMPELALIVEGTSLVNTHFNSRDVRVVKRYAWIITTGQFGLQLLHDVEWHLLCSLVDWRQPLGELELEGKRFVTRTDVLETTQGISNPELNRNLIGWSALWRCEVECVFNRAAMSAVVSSGG